MNPDSDSLGLSILVACFALLVAVTCAAVGWRISGHAAPLPLNPEPTFVPATAPDAEAIPYQSETP